MSSKPELTIELVPRTCWYSNVRSEVKPVEWNRIKTIISTHADHKCEICGGIGRRWPVECHEIWEYTPDYYQILKSMIALCPSCHEVKHIGLAQIKGNFQRALKHLIKINRWSEQEGLEYVQEVFKTWNERSKHTWKLDISYLHASKFLDLPPKTSY